MKQNHWKTGLAAANIIAIYTLLMYQIPTSPYLWAKVLLTCLYIILLAASFAYFYCVGRADSYQDCLELLEEEASHE